MKIAVFASGNGSNFEAIVKSMNQGEIEGAIVLVFSDRTDAYVLERAKNLQIPVRSFSPKQFTNKVEYEKEILKELKAKEVELLVLAGYMRLIGPTLLNAYPNRILNIHPALLPEFPGLHGIRDAFEAGVKQTGVTVHYVDNGVDTGPILAQKRVNIEENETLASLELKIHQAEHQLYPEVIQDVIQAIKKTEN
ncbi:phosphoribosylglycinamide formyltransferase [Carnobacterium divergens]|uniref:phosphoribosylglycinamide formyltransferase n=1 Tax=Carnobacterium divergens TaxID=2748 RepID=UPI0028921679|nr:phosphoribosylglycinamide formyltransferase [Carnobacterium divergens]MDT1940011.1 phosphoribosylglycinamide formyltransferase [Carnobacterium divergens]MDT1942449.1 phosphoribosylglycinamide formyltransferase [Carnobacterium divergens]MDT1948255.1 phosphoribosylglycinamide formyltransferase [Carnobacterium divergens]MDT1950735.1 phosphoribosylglycinamide formyltransferase [Carnobacterium divergens]MDT1956015.1 phosphoribosylglycinamide formyltransferase [Carnobacterium divergens]